MSHSRSNAGWQRPSCLSQFPAGVAYYENRGPLGTWCFLAPLLRQKHQDHIRDMNHFLQRNPDYALDLGIFEKLANLRLHGRYIVKRGKFLTSELSALESLPIDILNGIFCAIDSDPQALINFGVCSPYIWSIFIDYIQYSFGKSAGVWANTPIFCPWLYVKDFPPAIYEVLPKVKAEQDAINQNPLYHEHPAWKRNMVHEWVQRAFDNFAVVDDIYDKRRRLLEALSSYPALKSTLKDALKFEAPLAETKWALRNLTTKEYVRLEVSHSSSNGRVLAYIESAPWLNLDVALVFRTYWFHHLEQGPPPPRPTGPGILEASRLDVHKQGSWAGHRFDIVHLEPFSDIWTDATECVIKDAMHHHALHIDRARFLVTYRNQVIPFVSRNVSDVVDDPPKRTTDA